MPETVISNHFVNGLREDVRAKNGSENLVRCYGMRATEHGAVAQAAIADGTDAATVTWPHPQMFKGEGFTLCLTQDVLRYEKADGTLQTLPVYDAAPSGSELMLDTDFSSWDDTSSRWTIAGTTVVCLPGAASDYVRDTLSGALTASRLYRFTVTVSAVDTAESDFTRMQVSVGANQSEWQVPRVGVMEFDVYTAISSNMDSVAITCEKNVSLTLTASSLKLIAAVSDLGLVSTDKPFHMVSFGKIWMLISDTMMLLCAPMCGTAGRYSSDADYIFNWRVVKWTGTKLRAGCNYNDRLYLSGFDGADTRYDATEFQSAFDVFMKLHTAVMYESFEVAKNVIFYGAPLGGDVNWPFSADLAVFGLLDSTQSADFAEVYISNFRDGNQGFVLLPLQGRVLRMERLGAGLVCYAEDGVCLVQAVSENGNAHAVRIISNCGLGDNGLLACAEGFHMYVDRVGKLQFVSNEFAVRELGYEEFLATLITNKASAVPMAAFDASESEVYFSNGAVSYVRSRTGLGEVWTAATSLYQSSANGLSGSRVSIAPGNGLVRLKTCAMDFGDRAFKQFHDAEIGAYDVTNLKIRTHYKNNHSTTWVASEWQEVIRGGFVILQVSGYEVMFEVEFTPGANARFEYIKVNWQVRDQRNFRRQAGRI
jgi:hypothetical protein